MKHFYKTIRGVLSLIKNYKTYICSETYYPKCERKSKLKIFIDQLYIVLKYGIAEQFYFAYGFDRVEFSRDKMCSEYIIPYNKFLRRVNYLNLNNPRYEGLHKHLTGRVITADKFYFSIFLNHIGIPTPKVYLYIKNKAPLYIADSYKINTNISAKEQILSFLSYDMNAFAKPSDGQLGNGIFSLKVMNGVIYVNDREESPNTVAKMLMSADYLVQERIIQHPAISKLCSSTINSIRLQTVMSRDGNVIPFGAILRVAREGSQVDNWAKGGIAVGINMNNGTLRQFGIIKPSYGTLTYEHPDSLIKFDGYEIPFYHDAEKLAIKLHKILYRCHSIGWDIAITENGPVFIEANGLWEVSLIQAANGGLKKFERYFYE